MSAIMVRAGAILVTLSFSLASCSTTQGRTSLSCEQSYIGPMQGDSIGADGRMAWADLNCDGHRETIAIDWRAVGDTEMVSIEIVDGDLSGHVLLRYDGLPQILGFGDLNGDSIRDVLIASVDESGILANIVLSAPGGPKMPQYAHDLDWSRLQFNYDDLAPLDCLDRVRPRIVTEPGRSAYVQIFYGASWTEGCHTPNPARLVLRGDTLSAEY